MNVIGNILWFIFGGFFAFIGYIVAGVALAITIIGIPFALQSFKLGVAMLWPFGRELVPNEHAGNPLAIVFNIIWLVLFGWEIALNHLFWALLFAVTIIGLPFALQHLKLVPLALWPFGQDLRPTAG